MVKESTTGLGEKECKKIRQEAKCHINAIAALVYSNWNLRKIGGHDSIVEKQINNIRRRCATIADLERRIGHNLIHNLHHDLYNIKGEIDGIAAKN